MSTINFRHLRLLAIFSVVVETGSFAATARKLGSSRSRISEQVAALEADLGTRLLQRSTRQLKITEEGKDVFEQARQLPDLLQNIESIITPTTPSGRVSITMPHDIAHKYILPVLEKFQIKYPKIQLDLILDDSRLDLIDEQIDLAIRVGMPKDDSFIARIMHEESLSLYASPDYLKQIPSIKTLIDLESCHWILLTQVQKSKIQNLRKKNKTIEITPKSFYSCDSPLMVEKMISQGLGIGCLLPSTVKGQLKANGLIKIMPSITSEPILFSLVYPSRKQVPLRTRAVIDYLLAAKIFN